MTKEEHELMVMMFTRIYESIGTIEETLKSNGLWSGDDPAAFSHVVHSDAQKLISYYEHARDDYETLAAELKVSSS